MDKTMLKKNKTKKYKQIKAGIKSKAGYSHTAYICTYYGCRCQSNLFKYKQRNRV